MPIPNVETRPVSVSSDNRSYVIPFILVTSLFFLWGIANILNSALIAHFQPVFQIGRAEAMLVETAFYFGYFTIALPAGLFMEKYSYKRGILVGLVLYATGALLFVPAANALTFGFFLLALYIIASGLAFLETAANPYVTILGRPETSVQRLNFAQSFNGIGLVVGPWLAGHFIFAGNEGDMTISGARQQAAEAVIFPYTLIAGTVLVVAFLFLMVKMPEPDKGEGIKFNRVIFKHRHLVWAVFAQFCYVGAQIGIWGTTMDFVMDLIPETNREIASKYYLAVGTFLFVAGRFLGTWLMTYIKGHKLLTTYAIIACILCLVGVLGDGKVAVFAVLGINFFMSIMFPTIFALGVKDLGENTKLASSFLIMAIIGGAILPPCMGLLDVNLAFIIPAISFLVIAFFGWTGHRIKSKVAS